MRPKTRISLLILLVIGLHALPALLPGRAADPVALWPGPCTRAHFRRGPITVAQRRLIATFASGKEAKVTAHARRAPYARVHRDVHSPRTLEGQ